MKYLKNQSTNPYFNLALEEYVLRHRRDDDYLLLWQNKPVVVIGRHQNAEEEANQLVMKKYGIQLVRRETGGGAVYHDLGNLNFSFITDVVEADQLTMERFTAPIRKALSHLGIHTAMTGRNDLMVGRKKVSGNAQTICSGRILHHGTLLFDTNLKRAQEVLTVESEKFYSKGTKSVQSRIGNIKDFLPKGTDMDMKGLKSFLVQELHVQKDYLTEYEYVKIRKLKRKKYCSWNWNYGETPAYEKHAKKHFPEGSLETRIHVEDGRIAEIHFGGDFMALRPMEEAAAILKNCRYEWDSVKAQLQEMELNLYFGGIRLAEILLTIFG